MAGSGNATAANPKYDWTEIETSPFAANWTESAPYATNPVYDPNVGHVIVVIDSAPFTQECNSSATFALEGNHWVRLSTPTPCGIGDKPMMVYDAHDGYLLLIDAYGNYCRTPNQYQIQTWKFVNDRWFYLPTKNTPPIGMGCAGSSSTVYDASDGYVILFGGFANTNAPYHPDMRMYMYRGGVWTRLYIPMPGDTHDGGLAYDPGIDRVILPWNGWWEYHANVWSRIPSPGLNWYDVAVSGFLTYDPFVHGMLATVPGSESPTYYDYLWTHGTTGFQNISAQTHNFNVMFEESPVIFWPYDPNTHQVVCFGGIGNGPLSTIGFS
ncbi:MAG: hypothetical protein WCA77_06910 [Thermoplasmata archaeon]